MIDSALAADTIIASLRQSGFAEYPVADDRDAPDLIKAVENTAQKVGLQVTIRHEGGYVLADLIPAVD